MPDTFAARLKACRKRAGYSQKKVAHLSGISAAWLSQYEHGHIEGIGLRNLLRIKRALGCSWDDLLPGE